MKLHAALALAACAVSARAAAEDGRTLYQRDCAACHGDDGRGEAAREARFPKTPPDFTDCSFGTPEANSDWIAIVTEGGEARGFDRRMPAFREILTDAQIHDVVGYLRTFCTETGWPRGELNLPLPVFTEKAFPEDEAITRAQAARSRIDTAFLYERRIGARWQLETAVPFVFVDQGGDWTGGVGDIAFALKRVLAASLATGTILSGNLELAVPTGRTDRDLGGGTAVIEPSLLAAQLFAHHLFAQAQAGVGVSWDRSIPDEAFARLAIGDQIVPCRFGRMFAPMLEVTGTRALSSGSPFDVDLAPELQVTLSARQHIRAAVGASIPITDRADREVSGLLYLLWDIADGGLTEGW